MLLLIVARMPGKEPVLNRRDQQVGIDTYSSYGKSNTGAVRFTHRRHLIGTKRGQCPLSRDLEDIALLLGLNITDVQPKAPSDAQVNVVSPLIVATYADARMNVLQHSFNRMAFKFVP